MPELPEVETVRRALSAPLEGRPLTGWTLRNPDLRWPVSIPESLRGARLASLSRIAKYLVFRFDSGAEPQFLISHLGMSGSFRLFEEPPPPEKHDHIDLLFDGLVLRYNDPRRFGSLHYQRAPVDEHFLLRELGPDALSEDLDGEYLYRRSRGRRLWVKDFVMNAKILAGVGNIYASEALFEARIRPRTAAGKISVGRYERLAKAIRLTLENAIDKGGTTLRDFYSSDGRPGYFAQNLKVYDRGGQDCTSCGAKIRRLGGARSTFYCPRCQT